MPLIEQQIGFLYKSCTAFDLGDESEGIQIAGHLRTILHNSEQKPNYDSRVVTLIDNIREIVSASISTERGEFQNGKKVLNMLNGLKHKVS